MAWIQYHKDGEKLSFMNERNQEVEGEILSIDIMINKYQKNIVYEVLYLGSTVKVDGEYFRIIK